MFSRRQEGVKGIYWKTLKEFQSAWLACFIFQEEAHVLFCYLKVFLLSRGKIGYKHILYLCLHAPVCTLELIPFLFGCGYFYAIK